MKINSDLIKQLRSDRQWSQEQLGEACGLNLRTIQRLETTGKGSMESVRALAAVFELDAKQLIQDESSEQVADQNGRQIDADSPLHVIKTCFIQFANFSGKATRFEFWWFVVFFLLISAISTVIHPRAYQITTIVFLLPFVAVGTRRLNDIGHSAWLQLLYLVPFGFVPVFFMMAMESKVVEQT